MGMTFKTLVYLPSVDSPQLIFTHSLCCWCGTKYLLRWIFLESGLLVKALSIVKVTSLLYPWKPPDTITYIYESYTSGLEKGWVYG